MNTITLDIINKNGVLKEILTLGGHQFHRPMFSLINTLEAVMRSKANIDNYSTLQKELFAKFLNDEIFVYLMDDYIGDAIADPNYLDEKYLMQLEIMSIEQFTLWLEPKANEYEICDFNFSIEKKPETKTHKYMFRGKKPSERYTEATEKALYDHPIKRIRYSQIGDDIRSVSMNLSEKSINRPDAYKRKGADIHTYAKIECAKVISRYYYSENGILPLLWAELKYAIENDIHARQCACGLYFELKDPRTKWHSEQCKAEHRKKNDIAKFASIEDYRKAQNLRKSKERAHSQVEKDNIQKMIDKLKTGK